MFLYSNISYSISLCNLIFSYPYANNAFTPHNQHGFYGIKQVLHFAPLKQYALMIIMWVLLHGVFRHCGFKVQFGYCICEIFNDGKFNNSTWVLPKFVLVYGFIMQVLYVMYIEIVSILYHDMNIVMGIPSHNINFKRAM